MFEYSYRTGLLGSLWTMQAAIPYMKTQADGRIINFCSLQGVDGEPLFGDYDSTKEAIRGLTRTARSEEHTSELQSLMRISYAVFCLKKKITNTKTTQQKEL